MTKVYATLSSSTAAARSRLAASWNRSYLKHGLDPSRPARTSEPDGARLRDRRDEMGRVLTIAGPKLDDLFAMIDHCGCGIVLTDAAGLVIASRAAPADAAAFKGWGLVPGADWSEAAQGTNGIGTCLAEERTLIIHRDQHFLARNIGMSCIDAPVFGPDGRLLAALDVTSARADQTEGFNRLIEAMVTRVARQIEAEVFGAEFSHARILLARGDDPAGVALLAVDADDVVVGATREARRRHGLPVEGSLSPRPLADLLGDDEGGLEQAERAAVIRALTRSGGNVSEAARALGIGRATLYRRLRRLGIEEGQLRLSRD